MISKKNILLGRCRRPHGIKGGFSFKLINEDNSSLHIGSRVWLSPEDRSSILSEEGELHEIEKIGFGNKTIVYLKGISDRSVVESMVPFIIEVDRESLPNDLEEDEFYMTDLIGFDVFDYKSRKRLGVVDDYYDNGEQSILVITSKGGAKFDILFIESFVPVVDLDKKRVEIIIPEIVE